MFQNQHVVITGGSSGLGLELANKLAKDGAHLTLLARNLTKLEKVKQTLIQQHPNINVQVQSVDVCNQSEVTTVIENIAEKKGINILVNSAGILKEGCFETAAPEDFREIMDINFFGVINATRAALPFLKTTNGRIVNIASMAGLTGVYGYTSYCASKHALVGFSEALRYELKPTGVSVHLVCPGEFDSPMVDDLDTYRSEENRAHAQTIPKATVEQIASETISGIRSNRFMIIPGTLTRTTAFSIRHFTKVSRWIGDSIIARAQKGR